MIFTQLNFFIKPTSELDDSSFPFVHVNPVTGLNIGQEEALSVRGTQCSSINSRFTARGQINLKISSPGARNAIHIPSTTSAYQAHLP